MKRYDFKIETRYPNAPFIKSIQDDKGEWVRYEDVKWFCEGEVLCIEEKECNCEQMINPKYNYDSDGRVIQPLPQIMSTWICQAHGYKRR